MMWDEIKGDDGITRQLQWTSRVEGTTNSKEHASLFQHVEKKKEKKRKKKL